MTGALYWLAVGSWRVGAFIDTDGNKQIGTSGHYPPEASEQVVIAIRAIKLAILYPDNIQQELERTGLLHALPQKTS